MHLDTLSPFWSHHLPILNSLNNKQILSFSWKLSGANKVSKKDILLRKTNIKKTKIFEIFKMFKSTAHFGCQYSSDHIKLIKIWSDLLQWSSLSSFRQNVTKKLCTRLLNWNNHQTNSPTTINCCVIINRSAQSNPGSQHIKWMTYKWSNLEC